MTDSHSRESSMGEEEEEEEEEDRILFAGLRCVVGQPDMAWHLVLLPQISPLCIHN